MFIYLRFCFLVLICIIFEPGWEKRAVGSGWAARQTGSQHQYFKRADCCLEGGNDGKIGVKKERSMGWQDRTGSECNVSSGSNNHLHPSSSSSSSASRLTCSAFARLSVCLAPCLVISVSCGLSFFSSLYHPLLLVILRVSLIQKMDPACSPHESWVCPLRLSGSPLFLLTTTASVL